MDHEVEIKLPKLGESIVSATVVRWFKRIGDPVGLDEPLLEVSTDKVNSEIPSPAAGVLQEILAEVDQEVQVGEILAILSTAQKPVEKPKAKAPTESSHVNTSSTNDLLSPAVLRLARELKIPMQEIDRIPRTGAGGRLSKKDVEAYASRKKQTCPLASSEKGVERVKMTQFRKAIAENMVKSFYEAPHASLITEVDVTDVLKVIEANKQAFLHQHGAKLSITAFLARALSHAVQEYPLINSSLDQDTIVVKKFVNLGVAVSVDQGVMVPVIRDCQNLSLSQIAQSIATLAQKAREKRLDPADVQEGTITLTNFGMTGTLIGIPIIRHTEVAIVGLGAIQKKPVVMPDDSIEVRSIMWVSLTFDHRILDGLYGCGFLNVLKAKVEQDLELS